jgi:hypothetical protein
MRNLLFYFITILVFITCKSDVVKIDVLEKVPSDNSKLLVSEKPIMTRCFIFKQVDPEKV